MEFDRGAFVESVAVGVHATKRSGEINGKNLIVLGAGTIGNLTAQVAKASGANVMITDINAKKLNIAKKCGIGICVNTMEEDLGGSIKKYYGKGGVDVIIDCAAVKASINQALNNARCSSKIVIVGKFKHAIEIEIPELQRREVDIISAMMYVREDYEDAIELLSEGKLNTDLLISKYFNIREFEEAYKFIDDNVGDVMKVILKVGE
jgi:L-iditol 2-dehydrogenase